MATDSNLLWQPTPADIEQANLTRYMEWLRAEKGLDCQTYADLWQWSVDNIDDFWAGLWSYFDIRHSQPATTALASHAMPGAAWFPGARLNYAENIFARATDAKPMMLYKAEDQPLVEISWQDAYAQTARLAVALRAMGVEPGDRVVAYLPNIPEAIISLLAVASIGAIWSSCAPDFGSRSVLDRFTQIEPKVLIAVDGYNYGGKTFDRRPVLAELQAALPTLRQTVLISHLDGDVGGENCIRWDELVTPDALTPELAFEQVSFSHPLWVLYSSGTTGLPKPIVQSQGGIVLEHAKATVFHNDLTPNDRFFWYSSTGWMMWNYMVGSLLAGSTIILYNGSPAYPDINALWALAEDSGMTYFGTSAAYIGACMKAGIHPNLQYDLRKIRGLGSTGSPLTTAGFDWIYANVNVRLALESLSGGTDLCTAFVGGARILPIYAGEIQGALLGAKVQAFDDAGIPVMDEVGELVITEPMPSMPLYFWNDPDNARYLASYFEMYPGVWRHGDWIMFNQRGGCVIYGRSDSTINRQGVRMGTSEIYQAVEAMPEVLDSLIIDLELLGRESYLPLFVVLRAGVALDDDLKARIKQKIRTEVSPRHAPNDLFAVTEIPYTLSGKKMEVPIRKILLGQSVKGAVNPGAMRNPQAIDYFIRFAETRVD